MFDEYMKTVTSTGLRRLAGIIWTTAWCVTLYVVARPWRELGGWVDERLRWSAWAALLIGLTLGFAIGRLARRAAIEGGRVTHARLMRDAIVPLGAAAAIAIGILALFDIEEPIGVIVLGLLSVWSGADLAYGAVPLLDAEPYSFARPLPPPPAVDPYDDPEGEDRHAPL